MWLDFGSHAWYVFAMAPISLGAPSPRACIQADSGDFTPRGWGDDTYRAPLLLNMVPPSLAKLHLIPRTRGRCITSADSQRIHGFT
jgi:hypothetical protein